MKVLIIEDEDVKFDAVASAVAEELGAEASLQVTRAASLKEATKQIYQCNFDLIVVDFMLPRSGDRTNGPIDVSSEILELLSDSTANRSTRSIAITGFTDILNEQIRTFNEMGITIVPFDGASGKWRENLARELRNIASASLFDFIIVCALEKERQAFRHTKATIGQPRNIRGLDCLEIAICGVRGLIVRPPRMGLTDTAIITTRVIDAFRPKILAMSGICAGIPGEVDIGDIAVVENCFDYQVGKWTPKGFEYELYQTAISERMRMVATQLILDDPAGLEFRDGLEDHGLGDIRLRLVTNASGSSVVADKSRRSEIVSQHRKLATLEMEVFALYRAANLSPVLPDVIAVKGVVDNAGGNKGDKFHSFGSISSARFLVKMLERALSEGDA